MRETRGTQARTREPAGRDAERWLYALGLVVTLGLAGLASRAVIEASGPGFAGAAARAGAHGDAGEGAGGIEPAGAGAGGPWLLLHDLAAEAARRAGAAGAGAAGGGGSGEGGGAGGASARADGGAAARSGRGATGDGAAGGAGAAAGASGAVAAEAPAEPPQRGELHGVVIDAAERRPLAGATVRVLAGGRRFHEARCDGDGRFVIASVREGRYTVSARAPGYREGRVPGPVDLGPGESRRGLDIALARAGAITGRVTDPDGQPLADARVHVRYGGAFGAIGARTDADGRYELHGARPGRNDLTATHTDYLDSKVRIVRVAALEDGSPEPMSGIDFQLERGGAVAGWVLGPDGAVHGAPVELRDRRDRVLERQSADGGRFRFDGLARGTYKVRAGPTDGAVALATLSVPAQGEVEVTLELDPGGSLGGIVVDADGEPQGGVLVRADRREVAHRVEGRSRADGVFTLERLPDGSYAVRAIPAGAVQEPERQVVAVEGGAGPHDLVFRVAPGAVLAGRVVASDGGPAGGAAVSVHDAGFRGLADIRAAPDGTFSAPRLVQGELHVFARLGSELARERITIPQGITDGITIVLHRMGEAKGRVIDAEGAPVAGADVSVTSEDQIVRRTARTDKNGAWAVRDLYPGFYGAAATTRSQRSEPASFGVLPRQVVTDLELVLR